MGVALGQIVVHRLELWHALRSSIFVIKHLCQFTTPVNDVHRVAIRIKMHQHWHVLVIQFLHGKWLWHVTDIENTILSLIEIVCTYWNDFVSFKIPLKSHWLNALMCFRDNCLFQLSGIKEMDTFVFTSSGQHWTI
jgi:hypothetical protein